MNQIKIGDKVTCDLDGRRYVVIDIRDRNEVEKTNNTLLGHVLLLDDGYGNTVHVYGWEVTKEDQ